MDKLVYKSLKGKMGNELHALTQLPRLIMEIKDKIKNLINENDVCLFMKGTPESSVWIFNGSIKRIKTSKNKF